MRSSTRGAAGPGGWRLEAGSSDKLGSCGLRVAIASVLPPARKAVLLTAILASAAPVRAGEDASGLVDIGGGRKMYLECEGAGTPAVVLIAGGWEAGWIWTYALAPDDPVHSLSYDAFSAGEGKPQKLTTAVYPAVAKLTRVCLYRPSQHHSRRKCPRGARRPLLDPDAPTS